MNRVLFAVASVAALTFAVGVALDLHALRLAVKLLPVLAMIVWLVRSAPRDRERDLLVAGFVASLAGDAFLELDPAGLFVPGLVAFLIAHVFYVAVFTRSARALALPRAIPAYAYGAGVLALLGAHLGPMLVPVSVYTFVICTMLWRAAARVGALEPRTDTHLRALDRAAWLTLAGAASFAISDTMIAFGRFGGAYLDADVRSSTAWRLGIMSLYWLGQWGIASGHVAQRRAT
ncbi:MAG: lysoplasmalogenase [Myxococcota bacterium]|jgi:uncharacterized membrane protein YhhN|nr:lysoplasmalogenase [Myxococcota bacterium]